MRSRTLMIAAVAGALGLAACADITTPPPGTGKAKTPGKVPDAQVQTVTTDASA